MKKFTFVNDALKFVRVSTPSSSSRSRIRQLLCCHHYNHHQYHISIFKSFISTKPPLLSNHDNAYKSLKVWEIPVGTNTKVLKDVGTLYVPKSGKSTNTTITTNNTNNKEGKDGNTIEHLEWEQVQVSDTLHRSESNKSNDRGNLSLSKMLDEYILSHFLPKDYPTSVEKGYTTYASYCFLGNTCGSAAMVLSTQTLLLAVGVGSASAAPMAGALNWVMKDGIGQLGGVLFASRITSNATGNTIDNDPKRWRMVSSISMDAATLLEILSPLFPGHFLAVASIANIGKNISFLTASASRAAIHQSLAVKNNLGDVTAKAGSQSIAASLMGTGVGIGLSPLIGGEYTFVTAGFVCLSCVHQYCIFKSLKAVALKKLNRHRLNIALDLFFKNFNQSIINGKAGERGDFEELSLCPDTIARHEIFIPFISPDDSQKWLKIGCSIVEIAPLPQQLHHIVNTCLRNQEKYILNYEMEGINLVNLKKVMVTFRHDAKDVDIIRGLFHAHVIKALSEEKCLLSDIKKGYVIDKLKEGDIITSSHQLMCEKIDSFLLILEKSWEIKGESIHLESSEGFRFYLQQ